MKFRALSAILLASVISQLTGCSKVHVENGSKTAQEDRSTTARVVEIDRLLNAPLTGTPEDSDRRAVLRAERAALVNPHGGARNPPAPQVATTQPPVPNTQIVVAHDSRGNHESHRISAVDAMTPSERERYYKQLRLTNPRVVVPVIYSR